MRLPVAMVLRPARASTRSRLRSRTAAGTTSCEQRFDAKTVTFYVDGAPVANLTKPADWYWGGVPPRNQFTGKMDEIRVSSTIRGPDWIATEFANQSVPSTFYTLGPPIRP